MTEPAEPVTTTTPRPLRARLLRQRWVDLAMLHWEVPVEAASRHMPPGVRPDTLDGRTYVGLIAFRMTGSGFGVGPPVPFLDAYFETNVRLYSVDSRGRRGIVFRSMDVDLLPVVLVGRSALGLPYRWSRMSIRRVGSAPDAVLEYVARRRRQGPSSRLVLRPGPALSEPTDLDLWLTGRWGLHNRIAGATRYLTNEHEPWPLHRAEVLSLDDGLVPAAGFPDGALRSPDSVLWSPGVRAAFGFA